MVVFGGMVMRGQWLRGILPHSLPRGGGMRWLTSFPPFSRIPAVSSKSLLLLLFPGKLDIDPLSQSGWASPDRFPLAPKVAGLKQGDPLAPHFGATVR